MKYSAWTALVFGALARCGDGSYGGVGLPAVAAALGFDGLTWDDFARHEGMPQALLTAMDDLTRLGLVTFGTIDYGNELTSIGREVVDTGLDSIWPELGKIHLSAREAALLSKLFEASSVEEEGWADLLLVDANEVPPLDGLEPDEYTARLARMTLLGDLEGKGLLEAGHRYGGGPMEERPTYIAAVLLSESVAEAPSRLAGSSDTSSSAPDSEKKPATPRVKGRPKGSGYITDHESVLEAYRRAKQRSKRNPSRIPSLPIVAAELDVSRTALSDYLKAEGIPWPPE